MTPADNPAPASREAVFTLKRAAEVAGVSPSTLRRNKETLREHGATISENGWKVPMSALIASGLMRRTTPPDQPATAPGGTDVPIEDNVHERIRELERDALEQRHRAEIAELRRRAEVAEALADERGRMVEILSQKMLTTGPAATAPETAPEATPGPPEHREPERPTQGHAAPRTWLDRLLMRGPNR